MMKKIWKKLSAFVMSLCLFTGLAANAFAADSVDSVVTYTGKGNWNFAPGSGYTDTDLFDGLKDVMPGDVRTETITIKNEAKSCDYIKVYLQAVPHDENGNPLTYDEDFEEKDGKATGSDAERDETVTTMAEFLSQLSMRIYSGDSMIYEASPDETDGLKEPVYLVSLRKGKSVSLDVTLEVPIEMGNEYMHRVGEVDWKILVEEFNDSPSGGGGSSGGPGGPEGSGSSGGPGVSETTTILPFEIPLAALPQTGTLWWLVPILAALGIAIFFVGMLRGRKNKEDEEI